VACRKTARAFCSESQSERRFHLKRVIIQSIEQNRAIDFAQNGQLSRASLLASTCNRKKVPMCFNISFVLMRPLPCQIVTLSDLPVATAIPAVHQSTAETWEPAAINRNRLEEAMRSAERDRVVKPMRLSEKKRKCISHRPCLSRFNQPFDIVCVNSPDGKIHSPQSTFRLHSFSYAILYLNFFWGEDSSSQNLLSSIP